MGLFNKILYLVDDELKETGAVEKAFEVANQFGSKLVVADVLQPVTQLFSRLVFPSKAGDNADPQAYRGEPSERQALQSSMSDKREAKIREFLKTIPKPPADLEVKIIPGKKLTAVLDEIKAGGYDLLMKPASGNKGLKERFLGNIDRHLARVCPIPFWIKKPGYIDPYFRVAAAIDVPHEEAEKPLAASLLGMASTIARKGNGELHVVHAWHSGLTDIFAQHSLKEVVSDDELDNRIRGIREEHLKWLEKTVDECKKKPERVKIHLLEGEAEQAVSEMVKREEIDLLVIGLHEQSDFEALFLGSTTEEVLDATICSMLIVKPESFMGISR